MAGGGGIEFSFLVVLLVFRGVLGLGFSASTSSDGSGGKAGAPLGPSQVGMGGLVGKLLRQGSTETSTPALCSTRGAGLAR